jgi:hypothetical protein
MTGAFCHDRRAHPRGCKFGEAHLSSLVELCPARHLSQYYDVTRSHYGCMKHEEPPGDVGTAPSMPVPATDRLLLNLMGATQLKPMSSSDTETVQAEPKKWPQTGHSRSLVDFAMLVIY